MELPLQFPLPFFFPLGLVSYVEYMSFLSHQRQPPRLSASESGQERRFMLKFYRMGYFLSNVAQKIY